MNEPTGFAAWWDSEVARLMREAMPWTQTEAARACFSAAFGAGALEGSSAVLASVTTRLAIINAEARAGVRGTKA
jgi:hypothetical protein